MLAPLDDAPAGVLGFRAEDRLEPGELAAVAGPPVRAAIERGEPLRILVEVAAGFAQLDPMTAVAETKAAVDRELRRSARFTRGAVVTDVAWLAGVVGLMGWMVPGELRAFPAAERAAALAWVGG